MARGWESKSVEDQQAEAAAERKLPKARLTSEEIHRQQQIQGLKLSKQRVEQQLQSVQSPQHREMLLLALADLESRLSSLCKE